MRDDRWRALSSPAMLATYGSLLIILGASCVVGQALFALCGRDAWSWLAPAVGLAATSAVAWGTVRLPGEGVGAAVAIGALAIASLAYLLGHVKPPRRTVGSGLAIALSTVLGGSLPFFVEGRFGILGTGLNPDMSQHLFAADALAHGHGFRLLDQGYPLGPHALVVAVSKPTGVSLVHGFDGLMLAISVSAALVPLPLLERFAPWRRIACCMLVALNYMAASYLVQGAFKETMEAVFVLAFAVGLGELGRGRLIAAQATPISRSRSALAAIPLAALAVGAVYAYSFPGLLWLAGASGLWAIVELALVARRSSAAAAAALARAAAPTALVAVVVVCLACAPEIGRMIDFGGFETFKPSGPGLGNLFNPISPLEALGIWPSGDFRLDPGDGAVPAAGFYLGELLALAALAYGLAWWLRRAERAVPAALTVAAALYAYAHFAGTPYQAAKSIVIAASLAMLIAVRALFSEETLIELGDLRSAIVRRRGGAVGALARQQSALKSGLAAAFGCAAAVCSLLTLVNGPVGPATYSPQLTELRGELGTRSTLVVAPSHLLADEHGRDYIVWELRGGRVCVGAARPPSSKPPPPGISQVITQTPPTVAPYADLRLARRSGPYTLWERRPSPRGNGRCKLIAVGRRANPA
jgi:hypothetical protein